MLTLAAIDINMLGIIAVVCVFLAVGSFAWFAIDYFSRDKRGSAENRLDMLNVSLRKGNESKESKVERFAKVLEQASPVLSKHMEAKTEVERDKLKTRLAEAGFRNEAASGIFLTIKVIAAATGLFLAGGITLFMTGLTPALLLRSVLGGGIAFFAPEFILDLMRQIRCIT